MKLLQQLISDDYRVHMQLDNLPVAIQGGDRCVSSAAPLSCAMVDAQDGRGITGYHCATAAVQNSKFSLFGVHARAFVLIWLVYMDNLVARTKATAAAIAPLYLGKVCVASMSLSTAIATAKKILR